MDHLIHKSSMLLNQTITFIVARDNQETRGFKVKGDLEIWGSENELDSERSEINRKWIQKKGVAPKQNENKGKQRWTTLKIKLSFYNAK